jgi:hypothetical protein
LIYPYSLSLYTFSHNLLVIVKEIMLLPENILPGLPSFIRGKLVWRVEMHHAFLDAGGYADMGE